MRFWLAPATSALFVFISAAVLAAPPVVNTVPADPNNSLTRHDIISGRPTTLKGTVDAACAACARGPGIRATAPVIAGNVDADPVDHRYLDDVDYIPYWAVWAEHT